MKKILAVLSAALAVSSAQAQFQLSNSDFEQWEEVHYTDAKTCDEPLNWSSFYDKFQDWLSFSYKAAFYRQMVTLTGDALKKYAQAEGKAFCSFLSDVSYPLSGIGHEIVMEGLSELSTEYSDFAVSWLLSGFREKAFVYSSVQQDYLYHAGILIRRFSPYCSQPLFERLEQSICKWIDDKKWVKDCLKHRLNTLRNGNVFLEYFPYWGGF